MTTILEPYCYVQIIIFLNKIWRNELGQIVLRAKISNPNNLNLITRHIYKHPTVIPIYIHDSNENPKFDSD